MSAKDTKPGSKETALAYGAKVGVSAAIGGLPSAVATGLKALVDVIRGRRAARCERRFSEVATLLLKRGVSGDDIAQYLGELTETDEGLALLEAMVAEVEAEKTWAYTALVARFAASDDLEPRVRVAWLAVCRDMTNEELLELVAAVCWPREMNFAARTEPTVRRPNSYTLDLLIRWRLYREQGATTQRPSSFRRAGRTGDEVPIAPERFDPLHLKLSGFQLAHTLSPFAPIEWINTTPLTPETDSHYRHLLRQERQAAARQSDPEEE